MITELKLNVDSAMNQERQLYVNEISNIKRINLLFGGNGVGKSTLLDDLSGEMLNSGHHNFKATLDNKDIELQVVKFQMTKNNQKYNHSPQSAFEFVRHFDAITLSEGQGVIQTATDFIYVINNLDKDKHYLVLIDEIDTGLDVINIRKIVNILKDIFDNNQNMQVFISFNNFEMTKLCDTRLNMYNGKYESVPNTYDEYCNILEKYKTEHTRDIDKKVFEL